MQMPHISWHTNIGSGNDSVLSGNKPLFEQMLTPDLFGVTWSQWIDTIILKNEWYCADDRFNTSSWKKFCVFIQISPMFAS